MVVPVAFRSRREPVSQVRDQHCKQVEKDGEPRSPADHDETYLQSLHASGPRPRFLSQANPLTDT